VAAAVIGGTSIMGGRGGYGGTIVGALILTVLTALLAALGFPEAIRQVLFGSIIVAVAAAYTRDGGVLSRRERATARRAADHPPSRLILRRTWAVPPGGRRGMHARDQEPTRVSRSRWGPDAIVTFAIAAPVIGVGPIAFIGVGVRLTTRRRAGCAPPTS
jgi:hypothetical protein